METIIDLLGKQNLTALEIEQVRQMFILLMLLPIVATIIGFFRYIVGLKSLNLFAPLALTYAFYQLGYIQADNETNVLRGLKFGIFLYIVVFLATAVSYKLLRKVRMHYIPKTSIVLTSVVVSIILAITAATLLFDKNGFVYLDMISIIIIAALSDTFVSMLARKTIKQVAKVAAQTFLIATLSYLLISWDKIQNFVLNYVVIVLIVIVLINLYIGKFVGLRLTEYYRFRELLLKEDRPDVEPQPNTKK